MSHMSVYTYTCMYTDRLTYKFEMLMSSVLGWSSRDRHLQHMLRVLTPTPGGYLWLWGIRADMVTLLRVFSPVTILGTFSTFWLSELFLKKDTRKMLLWEHGPLREYENSLGF